MLPGGDWSSLTLYGAGGKSGSQLSQVLLGLCIIGVRQGLKDRSSVAHIIGLYFLHCCNGCISNLRLELSIPRAS